MWLLSKIIGLKYKLYGIDVILIYIKLLYWKMICVYLFEFMTFFILGIINFIDIQ